MYTYYTSNLNNSCPNLLYSESMQHTSRSIQGVEQISSETFSNIAPNRKLSANSRSKSDWDVRILRHSKLEMERLIDQYLSDNNLWFSKEREIVHYFCLYIDLKSDWSEKKKIIELGVLYSLLVESKLPNPQPCSLLEVYWKDVERTLAQIKVVYQAAVPKKFRQYIPSTRQYFLMNEFAWLVCGSNNVFNPGGCYAVKKLVDKYCYKTLGEFYSNQIDFILEQCLEDSQIVSLITKPRCVHPEWEKMIWVDLKLKKEGPLTPGYVSHLFLLNCFSIHPQQKAGDCFCVATNSYLSNHEFAAYLTLMNNLIEDNFIIINGVKIPCSAFFQKSEFSELVFSQTMEEVNFDLVPIMLAVKNALGISTNPISCKTLNEYFHSLGDQEIQARMIFGTFKDAIFHITMKRMLGFIGYNLEVEDKDAAKFLFKSKYIKFASILINMFKSKIFTTDHDTMYYFEQFLGQFIKKCKDSFWFIDISLGEHKIVANKITFEAFPHGLKFSLNNDYKTWQEVRKMHFLLEEDQLVAVSGLSEVAACYLHIAKELEKVFSPVALQRPEVDYIIQLFKTYLLSDFFKQQHALFVSLSNQKKSYVKINDLAQDYLDMDAFFIHGIGGHSKSILDGLTLKNPIEITKFYPNSIEDFVISTCRYIHQNSQIHSDLLKHPANRILMGFKEHLFTIWPLQFRNYLVPEVQNQIKKNIIDPGKRLQDRVLTAENQREILARAGCGNIGTKMRFKTRTVHDFIATVYTGGLNPTFYVQFNDTLYGFLNEISRDDIKNHLDELFNLLGMNVGEMAKNSFISHFDRIHPEKKTIDPYLLAYYFQTVMQEEHFSRVPLITLENAIRTIFDLPHVINLGDLGWTGNGMREKPKNLELIVYFFMMDDKLALAARNQNSGLHDLQIYVPEYHGSFSEIRLFLKKNSNVLI